MTRRIGHQTFVGTMIQSAPRIRSLLANMRPTWHLPSLDLLDEAFIGAHHITGLIWDVDGTLTTHHGPLDERVLRAFESLTSDPRLRHAILSNADERRTAELATLFPAIPIVRGYRSGDKTVYRTLRGETEAWTDGHRELPGGSIALRKPSAELVHEALRVIGCEPDGAVMIGDQYLTDVAGANLAGIRSIKLPTFARTTFPFPVRTSQRLETAAYRILHGRPRSHIDGSEKPR